MVQPVLSHSVDPNSRLLQHWKRCWVALRLLCLLLVPAFVGTPAWADDCGREGDRACTLTERIPSCDQNLVEGGGRCVRPLCGMQGQGACTVVQRMGFDFVLKLPVPQPCDANLVHDVLQNKCVHPACGTEGANACNVLQRIPSCDTNLFERNGTCLRPVCGRLGTAPCSIDVRGPLRMCDMNLIAVGGQCVRPPGNPAVAATPAPAPAPAAAPHAATPIAPPPPPPPPPHAAVPVNPAPRPGAGTAPPPPPPPAANSGMLPPPPPVRNAGIVPPLPPAPAAAHNAATPNAAAVLPAPSAKIAPMPMPTLLGAKPAVIAPVPAPAPAANPAAPAPTQAAAPAPAAISAPNLPNKLGTAAAIGGAAPGGGLAKIMGAGDLSIPGGPNSGGAPFQVSNFSPASGSQGARIANTKGFRGKVDSAVRKVEDAIFLSDANAIYPGALIQGQGFATGNFTPISIPRAGGRIAISNLNLTNGAVYNKTIAEVNRESVQTAVQEMLAQGVVGTAAGATFNSYETSSQSKFLFDLGVDVRYGSVAVNGQLNVQNASTKNYVFATFKQKYYDISFTPPTSPIDVFKDGANFTDPQNQIRSGNPPLYVNKVTYGRMVFFVAESESSSSDLSAALNAAYNGGASVKVNSKLTASEVLNSARISYVVVGGNAGIALKPIASSNGDMFNAVKAAIANEGAANYSPSSPGVPIAYSLSYLKNNGAALMAYSTGPYDQSDIQYTNLPSKWSTKAKSTIDFNDPDNDENTIEIDVDWNAGLPSNVMEFRLVQPAGHTWNKWMKILRSNNNNSYEKVQVGSGVVSKTIGLYLNEIGRDSHIIFSKAKFLGVETPVFSLDEAFEYLQPGSRVTFTWVRDSKGQQ